MNCAAIVRMNHFTGFTEDDWNRTIADNGGNPAITYDTVHLSEKGVVLMADAYRQALDDC